MIDLSKPLQKKLRKNRLVVNQSRPGFYKVIDRDSGRCLSSARGKGKVKSAVDSAVTTKETIYHES
jgi:hypothetical protein